MHTGHLKLSVILAAIVALVLTCGAVGPARSGAAVAHAAPGTLDQLLARIALYPDQLLAQILLSAGDPASIKKLDEWLRSMKSVAGSKLQDAAVKAGFEASFVALALFPQVVAEMAADIGWTTTLGQAFAADRAAVFDAIQRLRRQAQEVGTLTTTAQQEVTTKTTSGGDQVIVIEPANPQVVYVPQYNPTVVYTQPAPTTVVVKEDNSADAVAAGLIGFTAGIAIGAAIDNDYYYGPYGWRGGAYMYNDGWDDYWDNREDAREDWMDHREDLVEERSDRLEDRGDQAGKRQEQRTDRAQTNQQQRTERQEQRTNRTGSAEARGYGERSGTSTTSSTKSSGGAFSGYSSGKSERSASSRGQSSRSSARSSGSRGGGRRR